MKGVQKVNKSPYNQPVAATKQK